MNQASNCANCETPLKGSYCYKCGQTSRGTDKFLLTLINEAFEDIFSMNSRVWKTLGNLLVRPGFLSSEYFAGRRVRYIPPIRLYFTLSILFFITYALATFFSPSTSLIQIDDAALEQSNEGEDKRDINDIVKEAIQEVKTERAKEAGVPIEERVDIDEPVRIDLTGEDGANIPWLSAEQSAALEERFTAQVKKANDLYKVNPDAASEYFREVAPPLIFCLLPLFALLLKIFYIFKKMYYTQHLVLAVHNHCFVFLWLTIVTLIEWVCSSFGGTPEILQAILYAWCPFYLWRSLRVVYEQGRLATTIKFTLLGLSYSFLMLLAFAGASIFGILTV